MVSMLSLWLPILVAAIVVFLVSSLLHMVFSYHSTDFSGVPDEDGVRAALRGFEIPPGDYFIPYASSNQERGSDASNGSAPAAAAVAGPSAPPDSAVAGPSSGWDSAGSAVEIVHDLVDRFCRRMY